MKDIRLGMMIDKGLLDRIAEYQADQKVFSRSEAIRQLVEYALDTIQKERTQGELWSEAVGKK